MALLPTEDRRRAREDRRRAARYKAHLSLQVLAVAGNAVDCSGQTLDIGVGGVRFTIANKLPVGDTILYLVTRPGESSTAGIQCTGKILRCATKCNSHYHEVVATVESSVVVTQDEFRRLVSDAGARIVADLNSRSGKWLRTAVRDMAAATIGDWKEWKKAQPS